MPSRRRRLPNTRGGSVILARAMSRYVRRPNKRWRWPELSTRQYSPPCRRRRGRKGARRTPAGASAHSLEGQSQSKLHRPRVRRAGDLAEGGTGERCGGGGIAEVVGYVEELRPERHVDALGHAEGLLQRHVPVVEERVENGKGSQVAEGTGGWGGERRGRQELRARGAMPVANHVRPLVAETGTRSEEHTSELQSRQYLVCRLLLEKKL